jgi:uncharacterized protein
MTQHAPEERGTPGLDYPQMPDYPPATDYSSMPERTARPSYPLLPGRREKLLAQQEEVLGQGAAAAPTGVTLPRDGQAPAAQPGEVRNGPSGGARDEQEGAPAAGEAGERQERLAMLGYLTVPMFGPVVPLAARLTTGRASPWSRGHATQALNVWLTVFIYDISGAIMGAMLALDSPWVAVGVMVPLMVLLWGVTIARLIRAATAASEGRTHTFPAWLCSQIVH